MCNVLNGNQCLAQIVHAIEALKTNRLLFPSGMKKKLRELSPLSVTRIKKPVTYIDMCTDTEENLSEMAPNCRLRIVNLTIDIQKTKIHVYTVRGESLAAWRIAWFYGF